MKYHNYIFLKSRKSIFNLSEKHIKLFQKEFIKKITAEKNVILNSYTTLGLKANTQILLWIQADSVIKLQNFLNELMHTKLGNQIEITFTLFGMTRSSQYSSGLEIDTNSKGGKFLTIYPFNKTKEWYAFSFEKRKNLMKGHISIGRKFPQITQLLLYSFGVDDNEFIVSYETEDLSEFQKLVMDLRSDKVRQYTLSDTPIFTCVKREISEALTFL
jgi:chlorite dismutase